MPLEPPDHQINGYNSAQYNPSLGVGKNQRSANHLPRSLSFLETWGFGLTGHLVWITIAPAIHAALGAGAIFIWVPGTIVGILLNLQVQRLGRQWPEMSGGTPNYATRLLNKYPVLGSYGAIAYFFAWAAVPGVNALILTDLIKANLQPLGLSFPDTVLKIGFTAIAFIVAFSGTRALSILHLCFILPAAGFLLVFCTQGIGWLAISPDSPGFFPSSWSSFSFVEWAKWFFFAVYGTYACETASSFVADSKRPSETLRFLSFAAWLMPIVYLGGSWILMRLATSKGLGDNTFSNLLAAAKPFWGESASYLVTLLVVSCCLLASATTVSNCPRVLYQLALDGHLSPVFAVVSRREVLGPSLVLTFLISLACLAWGDVARLVMVSGTAYLASMMTVHFALWLHRGRPEVLWPWWSGIFLLMEAVVLVVGGLSWNWQDLTIGLLFPGAILVADAAIRRIAFPPFHPTWWIQRYREQRVKIKDFVALQVGMLIFLICSSVAIAWTIRAKLDGLPGDVANNLLILLLITVAFVGVAIASLTIFPQVASIAIARKQAEKLFITALDTVLDTVLVLDEQGIIRQSNPAAVALFRRKTSELIGHSLNQLLPGLVGEPDGWPSWSEQNLSQGYPDLRILEVTLSTRSQEDFQEYIVILRDITDRKRAEEALRESEARSRQQAAQLEQTLQELKQTQIHLIQTERMSSLGQLVAGVAHEINNPVNFIYGNISHLNNYCQDLIYLINLYQSRLPNPDQEIQDLIEKIDLDFLIKDMPKLLSSMKVGSDRIREIVLTLRNFSRLDEAEMKPVDIHEGIDSTLLILQNRLKANPEHPGIEVIKKYGNLPKVECYAGQLNQVFMNILSNAIDALYKKDKKRSPEDIKEHPSTIIICTQVLAQNRVAISIKDNGSGIPETALARLFDPFFTTKAVGEGTGLGLSISYQIVVDKHGGRLECISEVGQGAEFWIEIPIRQSDNIRQAALG